MQSVLRFFEAFFWADECPYPLFLTPSLQQPPQSAASPPDGTVHPFGLLSPTHRTSPLVVLCAAPVVCHECRTGGALRISPLARKGLGVDGFDPGWDSGLVFLAVDRSRMRTGGYFPWRRSESQRTATKAYTIPFSKTPLTVRQWRLSRFCSVITPRFERPEYSLKAFFFFKANREFFSADGGSLSTTKSCAPAFAAFQRALVAQRLPYHSRWSLVSAEQFSPRCAPCFNKTFDANVFQNWYQLTTDVLKQFRMRAGLPPPHQPLAPCPWSPSP